MHKYYQETIKNNFTEDTEKINLVSHKINFKVYYKYN